MPQDFDLRQFQATYFEECQDLLAAAEEHLGVLQANLENVNVDVLHAIFRSVHSIKGGAGAFNFTDLVNFSHILETTLDKLREGKIQPTQELVDCLISANDVLADLVLMAQNSEKVDPSIWKNVAAQLETFGKEATSADQKISLSSRFGDYNKTPQEEEEQGWGLFLENDVTELETGSADLQIDADGQGWGLFIDEAELEKQRFEALSASDEKLPLYKIKFVPEPHLLQFANEPLLLARELKTLGKCEARADLSRLPDLSEVVSDEAYLSWFFELRTERPIEDIYEVFEFVIDDCELEIEKIEEPNAPPSRESVQQDQQVDEVPVSLKKEQTAVSEREEPEKRDLTQVSQDTAKSDAQNKAKAENGVSIAKVSSIRVDLERVDKLVNMVGELVITQAMLKQQAEELPGNAGHVMSQGFEDLSAHTRELQESVMAIRMQPVKSVFSRIPRLVRELSAKLNKKIDLITSGEMTEVDKTVIEQLMDPLTHMIRNSVDHGIETQAERLESAKPERARIHLTAAHRSGRIQIEVHDDGRGINRERVLAKAIEKGIIDNNHSLEDDEIDNLIFAPGFSTAEQVSDVSGRGVGMDVVRRNIVNLGGRISVFSTPGEGTRFVLSLPLTLAVLDGMIVKCGGQKYIVPLTAIVESIHPVKEEIKPLAGGATLIAVRGEYIRVVNLYRLFNIKGALTDPCEALVVIVETERFGNVGIMVDELLGQQQVVIKSLEDNYDPVAGIAAATIMGNGKVSLILDVDGLAEMEHGYGKRRKHASLTQQALLSGE